MTGEHGGCGNDGIRPTKRAFLQNKTRSGWLIELYVKTVAREGQLGKWTLIQTLQLDPEIKKKSAMGCSPLRALNFACSPL
jgi:hypothetical protein